MPVQYKENYLLGRFSTVPFHSIQLQRKMNQPKAFTRQIWHPASADIDLKRRVKQPWRRQPFIASLPHRHKLLLADTHFQVFVTLSVLADAGIWNRRAPFRPARRVVVARPDLDMRGEAEEALS